MKMVSLCFWRYVERGCSLKNNDELQRVMGAVYATIDERAQSIEGDLPLQCALGCCACCLDDLSVCASEAEYIRVNNALLLENEEPHAKGACAFLDTHGACRIYPHRPYICRTHGLPLRWFDDGVEYRDICEKNETVLTDALPASMFWTLGAVEQHLGKIDAYFFEMPQRVLLRDLFREG